MQVFPQNREVSMIAHCLNICLEVDSCIVPMLACPGATVGTALS